VIAVLRDDAMPDEERDGGGSIPPGRALSCASVADEDTALQAARSASTRERIRVFMTVTVFEGAG
jgi:hypothetical protein